MIIYDRYNRPIGEQLEFAMPSLTEQHHKDDCDINVVLDRYMKTGELECSRKQPLYGDFSTAPQDYRTAVELLKDANEKFESLPSAVRERFGNNPEMLLQFLEDPSNRDEAVRLGLVSAKTEVAPETAQNENNREAVTAEGGENA